MTDSVTIALGNVIIDPRMTVDQISSMCMALSTEKVEVSAHVEHRAGKPVAYLVGTPRAELPPDFLRK